ncbi:NUDIX domain-containing protein [Candidatus Synchoanobacter obligatus]|uniref:8-oxo-dGTP diphosphatase n=1 Tax=Candidatus Synchoanobacter obligatus TaxID=2919597 RepID=A0ABT1L6J2_9GAMM|nr:NUDIX domain-containing protein [Candidatus Synchoanobacter obligatus]MCP8352063.1 NUDIX domain-containing protein [Candidatus Synchoanobacter obligatus]
MTTKITPVAIGLILKEDKVLLGKRNSGHFSGFWEYPGGKIEPFETSYEALLREMHEELSIHITDASDILHIRDQHPLSIIHLQVWLVHAFQGQILANEQQDLQWANISDLSIINIIPTNIPITHYLRQLRAHGQLDTVLSS